MSFTIAATFGCLPFSVMPFGADACALASSPASTFAIHCLRSAPTSSAGRSFLPLWQSTQAFGKSSFAVMPGIFRAAGAAARSVGKKNNAIATSLMILIADNLRMDAQLRQWRLDTPGCDHVTHLNNAGASLMPRPVLSAITEHLQREALMGGYESADAAVQAAADAYAGVARLIGAQAKNIAVVENATVAFFQALSAFDFREGDVIVTTRNDYISNQLAYLSLAKRRGVIVERAADLPSGGVDPDSVRDLLRKPNVRLIAVTWIPTNSGLIQPVETIGEIAEQAGVPY